LGKYFSTKPNTLKYPLEHLDYFIYKILCPPVLINAIKDGRYTSCIWENALTEDENAKMELVQQVALAEKKKQILLHVNAAHRGCINLSGTLSGYIAIIRSLTDISCHHQQVIQNYIQLQNKIDCLIRFIEENFGRYCTAFKHPVCHLQSDSLSELRLRFNKLKLKLQQQCSDFELLNIVISAPEEFFNAPALNIDNYEHFLYFKEYIYHLEKLLSQDKTSDIEYNLKECLLRLNYNKFSFIDYIMIRLRTGVDEIEPASEKMLKWYSHLKEFKQLQHLSEYGLFPDSPSLKEQIVSNIHEEIICLEKQEQLKTMVLPVAGPAQVNEERLLTSFSVPQLALFTRLLIDTEILQTKNHTATLRKIAASMRTSKTDSISAESLRIKFYNPESASKNIMKDCLLKMINQLRSY